MTGLEEIGKATNTVVESMKSTPAVLALVLFNIIFMAVVAWASVKNGEHADRENERWHAQLERLLKMCGPHDQAPDQK